MWRCDQGTRGPRIPFLTRRLTPGSFLYLPTRCPLEPDSCAKVRAGFWEWCPAEEQMRSGRKRLDSMWRFRNGSMSRGRLPGISTPPSMGHTMPMSIWGPSVPNSCFEGRIRLARQSRQSPPNILLDVGLRAALLVCGSLSVRDDRVQLCDGVVFARAFRISATVLASRPAAANSLSVVAAMFARLPYCLSRRARVISPMPIT
jgi:hypothetical protein